MWAHLLGQEDPLEEEMENHSNILVWDIPWTEVPGGLQPMRLTKGHTRLRTHTHTDKIGR